MGRVKLGKRGFLGVASVEEGYDLANIGVRFLWSLEVPTHARETIPLADDSFYVTLNFRQ